jgi:hypothetical protein
MTSECFPIRKQQGRRRVKRSIVRPRGGEIREARLQQSACRLQGLIGSLPQFDDFSS